jgi:hypothetical protein
MSRLAVKGLPTGQGKQERMAGERRITGSVSSGNGRERKETPSPHQERMNSPLEIRKIRLRGL